MTQGRGWGELPWWERVLMAPLAVVVFPISLAALLAVLLPVALWHAAVWSLYWVRFRVAGIPIPPKGIERLPPTHGDRA
jgi:hypothetical protein